MQWIKSKRKFIAGLFGALVVLWLSTRSTRHSNKSAQHKEAFNTLRDNDNQTELTVEQMLKHNQQAAYHVSQANAIKKIAEEKIKKIKGNENETINTLVDRWNATD